MSVLCTKLVQCGLSLSPGQSCESPTQAEVTDCCKGGCNTPATGYCNDCIHDLGAISCAKLLPGGPSGSQLDMPPTCIGCAY